MAVFKDCSKVADKESHLPHRYYYGGVDNECVGYDPAKDPASDNAETPEEFYGLSSRTPDPDLPVKDCEYRFMQEDHVSHEWFEGDGTRYRCFGYDQELEDMLWEEEVIEIRVKHEAAIMQMSDQFLSVGDIAQELDLPVLAVSHIIADTHRRSMDYPEPVAATKLELLQDWYDNLRPYQQDAIMLGIALILFMISSFVINAIVYGG